MLVQHEQQQITSRGYQPKVSSEDINVLADVNCSFVYSHLVDGKLLGVES